MSATRFKTESGTVYEINHEGTYAPQHPSADCTLRLTSPVTVIL